MRILLVEDEPRLAAALAELLKKNRITADIAARGDDGLDFALTGIYDVILLDVMLPGMSGLEVLRELRKKDAKTPVIMLTALGEISDKVTGLDFGADDYLPKPFAAEELLARIRAVGRRRSAPILEEDGVRSFGKTRLSTRLLRLSSETGEISLTMKECELLEYLIINSSVIVPKERIIEKVWGYDSEAEDNHVEVYISFLRKKLAHIESDIEIQTVRGAGYHLREKADV